MKNRGNQKGFTLLELLVAVAILAVVVVPILTAFLMSSQINSKAKQKQRAHAAATNVMEQIKGESREDFFQGSTKTKENTFQKIYLEEIDDQMFTVLATVTGQTREQNLNELYAVEEAYDGIYIQTKAQDLEYARRLNRKTDVGDVTTDNMYRKIKINITRQKDIYQVEAQTCYNLWSENGYPGEETEKQIIFQSEEKAPRNVYLFYEPMYNGSLHTIREKVEVCNPDGIPVNIYLVAQQQDVTKDKQYVIHLDMQEKEWDKPEQAVTKVRSNLSKGGIGQPGLWLTYQGENVYKNVPAATWVSLQGLAPEKKTPWVYEVQLETYRGQGEQREHESIVTLETTITKE